MDPELEAILNPSGVLGRGLAQMGMPDYQKTAIGVMIANGAANQEIQTQTEQVAEFAARALVSNFLPGGRQLLSAGDAAYEIELGHRELIEQMEDRGVPGYEAGVFVVEDFRGNEYRFNFWTDGSAEEFGGSTRVYMEPIDDETRRALERARDNSEYVDNELGRKLRAAGNQLEGRVLEDIQEFQAGGGDYRDEVSRGLTDINRDIHNGSFSLASATADAGTQFAQAEPEVGTVYDSLPTRTI